MSIVELSRTPNLVIPDPVELHAENPTALPEGYPVTDRFSVQELVDRRARSTLYRVADHKEEDDAVLKIITEDGPAFTIHAEREFAAMAVLLGKPRIAQARAFGSLQTESGTYRYLVMDRYGSSLASRILEGLDDPVDTAVSVGINIGLALNAVHNQGLAHGDIGPRNIVEDGDTFRLIDFGSAEIVGSPEQKRLLERRIGKAALERAQAESGIILSTPRFTAAERISGACLPSSDVYAMGKTLRLVLTRGSTETDAHLADTAAYGVNQQPALGRSQAAKYESVEMPKELDEIVAACLSRDPLGRPTPLTLVRTLLSLDI